MLGRVHVLAAAALCISSYALGATPSIGSVTGHIDGEFKIDNYSVRGNGTVFDGSTIETSQSINSIADVRLGNHSVITLEADSRGTVYRDRFVLQRGRIKVSASNFFRVEVNGLVVTPSEPPSSELVSIEPNKTVDVEANTGNLEVLGPSGRIVAQVHPGNPLAFSPESGEPSSATGKVVSPSHADSGTPTTVLARSAPDLVQLGLGRSNQSQLIDGLRISPIALTTVINKCLSVSINGQTESLCCSGGPTPEYCCPGANQFSSGLCCVSGAPGSMCHHSN
jgi:hypothetical protein